MKLIGLDFETFYEDGPGAAYTLRKLTIEEYIRDPRFETITAAVKAPAGDAWSFGAPADIKEWLQHPARDWGQTCVISWNAHFDGAILAWRYGVRPRMILCAMAMWRMMGYGRFGGESLAAATEYAVSEGWPGVVRKGHEVVNAANKRWRDFTLPELRAYRRYCEEDASNALALAQAMMDRGFPKSELICMGDAIRAFTEPRLVLDKPLLQDILDRRQEAMKKVMALAGVSDIGDLRSDDRFAEAVRAVGYEPGKKRNAKGELKYAFAKTDEFMQDSLSSSDEVLSTLIEARLATKSTLTESRSKRFVDIAGRGRWPVFLKPGGARTHRFSGGDKVNPQNASKTDGTRDAITVPPGFILLAADSSQVEARFVAYDCEQADLVEDFANKVDVYCKFGNGSGVFPESVTKATVGPRFISKGVVLGGGYGSGASTMHRQTRNLAFSLGLDVDLDVDWQALNDAYRRQNPRIKRMWYQLNDALRQLILLPVGETIALGKDEIIKLHRTAIGPGLLLPNGLMVYYHNLRVDEETGEVYYDRVKGRSLVPTRIYGAKVLENHTQAVSGIAIREQWTASIVRGRRELGHKYSPFVLQVHDELVAMLRKGTEMDFAHIMVEELRRSPAWAPGVPLDCEIEVGDRYGRMEELELR